MELSRLLCTGQSPHSSPRFLLLLGLTSLEAQVTADWMFTDDTNKFAPSVAGVRKTTSYLTNVKYFHCQRVYTLITLDV